MITVSQQRTALATVAATITGITKAVDYVPRTIEDVQLPIVVVLGGRATYDRETYGAESLLVRRRFQLQVYVALEGMRTEGKAEEIAEAFIELFQTAFGEQARLMVDTGDHDETFDVFITGDSGVVGLNYPPNVSIESGGKSYTGFVFELETETERNIDVRSD